MKKGWNLNHPRFVLKDMDRAMQPYEKREILGAAIDAVKESLPYVSKK